LPRFNPLSTGHALSSAYSSTIRSRRFNPLSTGHARKEEEENWEFSQWFQSPIYGSRTRNSLLYLISRSGFNPLSTGHARTLDQLGTIENQVSIPYLRVTHLTMAKKTVDNDTFQSPIYGSRTSVHLHSGGGAPGFNPLSTGHALNIHRFNFSNIIVSIPYLRVTHARLSIIAQYSESFQSPIYGSRTDACGKPLKGGMSSFNPLSTGHAPCSSITPTSGCSSFNPLSTGHAQM